MEYFCVYKTGKQQKLLVFERDDMWYIDKKKVIHYIPNLFKCRLEENALIGMQFERTEENLLLEHPEIITRVYDDTEEILG